MSVDRGEHTETATVAAVLPTGYGMEQAVSCIDCNFPRYHKAIDCPQRRYVIEGLRRDAHKARQRLADLTGEPA